MEKGQYGEEYIAVDQPAATLQLMTQAISPKKAKLNQAAKWRETYGSWTQGYELEQVFSAQKAIKELGWIPRSIFQNEQEFTQ
ncbi:hypothetical protein [Vibrio sonorensis]|uniref:hypothetical protein n=1 Tax=Vibrio sonorensis TaxID=1004316 RepID=UPI0008D9379D|nr:hypothetical protein [Vibrio sonorensis]